MIFNNTVLKKMMKSAYKGAGLLVASDGANIIIGGTYWRVSIQEDYFPKKAKAALVELIGQLPQAGESYRCTSSGNQMEMPGEELKDLIESLNYQKEYRKADMLIDCMYRIRPYQSDDETIFLNEIFDDLLDGQPEDYEDNKIKGPFKREGEHRVFFETETCILEAWEVRPIPEQHNPEGYYKALEQMEIMLKHEEQRH